MNWQDLSQRQQALSLLRSAPAGVSPGDDMRLGNALAALADEGLAELALPCHVLTWRLRRSGGRA